MERPSAPAGRGADAAVALGLAALVAAIYWPVRTHGFIGLDDGLYVENPLVRRGLTMEGLAWAFTPFQAAYWHPVTFLSHMLDVELFGLDAGAHHAVSVVLHSLTAVLLFGWLRSATGSPWRSAFAAALFAVHPLRVESVAWIAERKDVLSGLAWVGTLWAYLAHARRPSLGRYLLVAGAFALALMAKPMAVTLPAILLLLDGWPLRRGSGGPGGAANPPGPAAPAAWPRLVVEKLPLAAVSLAVAALTVSQADVVVARAKDLSFLERLGNAALSYATYLADTIWPTDLAVIYPHPAWQPGGLPLGRVALSVAALAAISAAAWWQRRARPSLAVGWAWYLLTLLPVIGIVQAGIQGRADRFTYIPSMGLGVAVAWLLPAPRAARRATSIGLALVCAGSIAALAVASRVQVRRWVDTLTLFEHTIRATEGNWQALEILGGEYLGANRPAEAVNAFRQAVRARPRDALLWQNLAAAHSMAGDHAAAAAVLEEAVVLVPRDEGLWYSLAVTYAWLGQPARILELVERLRAVDPALAGRLADRVRRTGPEAPPGRTGR